jgi:hypothetical protein
MKRGEWVPQGRCTVGAGGAMQEPALHSMEVGVDAPPQGVPSTAAMLYW